MKNVIIWAAGAVALAAIIYIAYEVKNSAGKSNTTVVPPTNTNPSLGAPDNWDTM